MTVAEGGLQARGPTCAVKHCGKPCVCTCVVWKLLFFPLALHLICSRLLLCVVLLVIHVFRLLIAPSQAQSASFLQSIKSQICRRGFYKLNNMWQCLSTLKSGKENSTNRHVIDQCGWNHYFNCCFTQRKVSWQCQFGVSGAFGSILWPPSVDGKM